MNTRTERQQELDELRQRQKEIEAETAQIEDKLADIENESRPMEKRTCLALPLRRNRRSTRVADGRPAGRDRTDPPRRRSH